MVKKQVLGVNAPKENKGTYDKKDPFYGATNVKAETLVGTVVKKDAHRSATIEWRRAVFVPKYERQEQRKSRIRVHNPASVDAKVGDRVLVARTRPLSKTKHHVILKVLSADVESTTGKKE